jgi:hypothetical protein
VVLNNAIWGIANTLLTLTAAFDRRSGYYMQSLITEASTEIDATFDFRRDTPEGGDNETIQFVEARNQRIRDWCHENLQPVQS